MTESEWWAATEPRRLVRWLFDQHSPSDRKRRLFAHACATHLWQIIPNWHMAKYLGVAGEFIDGKIDHATLRSHIAEGDAEALGLTWSGVHYTRAHPPPRYGAATDFLSMCCQEFTPARSVVAESECLRQILFAASVTAESMYEAALRVDASDPASLHAYAALLHEIFGPLPFRDVPIDPAWLTSTVVALARGIYDDKDFTRMPILADALQDADCTNAEILKHCRDTNHTHVRGCWVLDLLLGRPWREANAAPVSRD